MEDAPRSFAMTATSAVSPFGLRVRTSPWLRRRAVAAPANAGARPLRENTTAAFRPSRGGLTLRCSAGTVLVTQSGDAIDHVLVAGDAFRTTRRGRVVAWALSDATLEVASRGGGSDPQGERALAA
jgi:hypothetical protein